MQSFPFHIVDLTHTLSPTIPTWDGGCGFHHRIENDYKPNAPYPFRTHHIQMKEGIGTHIDAPAHCFPNALTIDQLPINDLLAPCVVIDVSSRAHGHYCVSVEDIEQFEQMHGTIPPKHFVMIKTGWSQYWNDPEKYRNNYRFPYVSKEAALWLIERQIVGLGIDTLSPDIPDLGFPVHAALLSANKFIVENAANLDELPAIGSFILALPIKIGQGTEAPIRLAGFIKVGFLRAL